MWVSYVQSVSGHNRQHSGVDSTTFPVLASAICHGKPPPWIFRLHPLTFAAKFQVVSGLEIVAASLPSQLAAGSRRYFKL